MNKKILGIGNAIVDIFTKVKPEKIKLVEEGDLLFFKIRKGQISHVGIYLQNGKFAHATTQAGVIISDLSEPYYKKYFFKAACLALDLHYSKT